MPSGPGMIVNYGPFKFAQKLDADGQAQFVLDLFAGLDATASITMTDGTEVALAPETSDLDQVIKVAIVWRSPVDLDLHALEYAARRGEDGHVWAGATGDAAASRTRAARTRRGRGFMSMTSDGTETGDKVEVYTFWRSERQRHGLVEIGIDDATRGDVPRGEYCGDGKYAAVDLTILRAWPGRPVVVEPTRLERLPCGKPLSERVRYNFAAVRDLSLRR